MSNNSIQLFENTEIRFVEHPEKKYGFGIVATDLAVVLESEENGGKFSRYVEADWKGVLNVDTPGGNQSMTVIWEPGIYQLLAKSRKPKAKPFQKWVFEKVLPQIRETGKFESEPAIPKSYAEAMLGYAEIIKEAAHLALAVEKAEAEKALIEQANQKLEEKNELLEIENGCLTEEVDVLSEAVDELFNYSSIIRVAKFNNVSEKLFKWQTLKSASIRLGLEIKRVPDPRFVTKNLYSHDAWRVVYPDFKLPETTTLMIVKN